MEAQEDAMEVHLLEGKAQERTNGVAAISLAPVCLFPNDDAQFGVAVAQVNVHQLDVANVRAVRRLDGKQL